MIRELERLGEMKYFETIVLYLIHVTESFSVDHLKEHLTMEGRQKLMTVAEKLRQEGIEIGISEGIEIGRSEGIKIGKSEGKLEEKRSFALRLLKLKMSEQDIMQVTGLTAKEIEDLMQSENNKTY